MNKHNSFLRFVVLILVNGWLSGCGLTHEQARVDAMMASVPCFVTSFDQEIRAERDELCPSGPEWFEAEWHNLHMRLGVEGDHRAENAAHGTVVLFTDGKPPCTAPMVWMEAEACLTDQGIFIDATEMDLWIHFRPFKIARVPHWWRVWPHEMCHLELAVFGHRVNHRFVQKQWKRTNGMPGFKMSARDEWFYKSVCERIGEKATALRRPLSDPQARYP